MLERLENLSAIYANPHRFMKLAARLHAPLWLAAVGVLALGLIMVSGVPDDYQQGATVRIMFVHVPAAWMALFAYSFIFFAGIVAVVSRDPLGYRAARAAGFDQGARGRHLVKRRGAPRRRRRLAASPLLPRPRFRAARLAPEWAAAALEAFVHAPGGVSVFMAPAPRTRATIDDTDDLDHRDHLDTYASRVTDPARHALFTSFDGAEPAAQLFSNALSAGGAGSFKRARALLRQTVQLGPTT